MVKFDLIKEHENFSKMLLNITSIQEARAVNACLNRCFQKDSVQEGTFLPVDVLYFQEVASLPTVSRAYEELSSLLASLMDEKYVIDLGDGRELTTRLIVDIIRDARNKTLQVCWNFKVIPLLFGEMEAKKFTFYDSRMAKVASKSRLDMYKLIERNLYKLEGENENEIRKSKIDENGMLYFYLSENEIRLETGNENTYVGEFKNIVRRVVEPAVADMERITGRKLIIKKHIEARKLLGIRLYDAEDSLEKGKERLRIKGEMKRKEVGTKRTKAKNKDVLEGVGGK